MPTSSLTLPGRFNGPPTSANGGYAAGRLAQALAPDPGEAVAVRLRRPPALDRPLDVRASADGAGLELVDGDELVATAAPATLDEALPALPTLAEARAAGAARARPEHPFPTCFGCGPGRPAGESVAALLGPLPGRPDVFAGTWTPTAQLPHEDGVVSPEVVWVALDCPAAQPVAPDDGPPHVLGTITAALDGPVRLGEEHVLLAWALGRDGRKAHSAAAVLGPDGAVLARSRTLWIALPGGPAA